MKVWNVIHRSLSVILLTLLTLVLISSYGAGNVVASYAAKATAWDSVSVAKFSASISKVEKSSNVIIDDENAKTGVCFPFAVTVNSEATCVMNINVDFDKPTEGIEMYLMRYADDHHPLAPNVINRTRDHWEFHGTGIGEEHAELTFLPSSEPVSRTYYLLFKEAKPGSINTYQVLNNIEVRAKIIQKD